MPPPRMSRSVSITSTSGAFIPSSSLFTCELGQRIDAQPLRFAREVGVLERGRIRFWESRIWIDGAPGGRADRELESLHPLVAELDGPHDRVGSTQRGEAGAERHHV